MRQPVIRPEAGRAPAVDAGHAAALAGPGPRRRRPRGAVAGYPQRLRDRRRQIPAGGRLSPRQLHRISRRRLPPTATRYADKTVVSYCTGGIRCEKAALHMQALGMERVYQLEGGILKYFEETGGAHWQGDCFVFDGRGAVDPSLAPAPLPAVHKHGRGGAGDGNRSPSSAFEEGDAPQAQAPILHVPRRDAETRHGRLARPTGASVATRACAGDAAQQSQPRRGSPRARASHPPSRATFPRTGRRISAS